MFQVILENCFQPAELKTLGAFLFARIGIHIENLIYEEYVAYKR
jgi:hypothetical protein